MSKRTKVLAALAVALLFGGLTAVIAFQVKSVGVDHPFDQRVAEDFNGHATSALTTLARGITILGSGPCLAAFTGVAAIFLLQRRRWPQLLALLAIMLGGSLLNVSLKHEIRRPRPVLSHPLATLETYSFPSAHAMGSTLFYGWLAVSTVNARRRPLANLAIALAAVLCVGTIALTRLYLGLHFVSDVLAGICAGAAWLAAVWTLLIVSQDGKS